MPDPNSTQTLPEWFKAQQPATHDTTREELADDMLAKLTRGTQDTTSDNLADDMIQARRDQFDGFDANGKPKPRASLEGFEAVTPTILGKRVA